MRDNRHAVEQTKEARVRFFQNILTQRRRYLSSSALISQSGQSGWVGFSVGEEVRAEISDHKLTECATSLEVNQ